jgi:RNA polymerase sigma factor (sigma-70 family)
MSDSIPDQVLLGDYLGGDDGAFETLVRRHGPAVRATCARVLGRSAEVDDATQSVLVVLSRRAADARAHPALGAWLHRVAWHAAMGARRRASLRSRREREAGALSSPLGGSVTTPPELVEALETAIDDLPEKYRIVVILHHLQGQPEVEIARRLGCGESAISMRLTRARRRLRERLGPLGAPGEAALVAGALRLPADGVDAARLAHATLVHARAAGPARFSRVRPSRWCAAAASIAVLALTGPLGQGDPPAAPVPVAGAPAPSTLAPAAMPARARSVPLDDLPTPRPFDATRALTPGHAAHPRIILRQPDGKLVMVGETCPAYRLVLARYQPDGTLDPTFGDSGVVVAGGFSIDDGNPGHWWVLPRAATLEPDGGIAVGVVLFSHVPEQGLEYPETAKQDGGYGCGIMHFRADGTPDGDFGSGRNGSVRSPVGLLTAAPCGGGRLLFAGMLTDASGGAQMRVLRLAPDGRLDPTFGRDGVSTIQLPGTHGGEAYGGVQCGDGSVLLLIAGGTPGSDDRDLLARLTPEGALDPSFGDCGLAWTGHNFGHIAFMGCDTHCLALLHDGRIVIAGNRGTTLGPFVCSIDAVVMRFSATGTPDEGFGDHGMATLVLGETDYMNSFMISSITPLPDGRLVIGGSGRVARNRWRPTLAYLGPDGALDPAEGEGGMITADLGAASHVGSVLLDGDRLRVGVDVSDPADPQHSDMALLDVDPRQLPPAPGLANN